MDKSKKRVLVAGGAGFIGSHLCKSLLDDNYKVICVDNFLTSDKSNLQSLLQNPSFILIEHDLIKPIPALRFDSGQKIDCVFHLASPASPNKKSKRSYMNFPIETLLVNSLGTYNLLDLSRKFNAKFLYASSSEVYGDPAMSPQKEEYFGNVNPNGARSVYDEGKRFGEALTMGYVRKYNLDARVIRIFNTYGPVMLADDGRVVSNFISQAIKDNPITVYGKGAQTRSFCYIDDMILGVKLAMFSANTKGEVFNLGNPDERTVLDIAKLIKNMTSSGSEMIFEQLPEGDPKVRKPDITKAKEILKWEPKVTMEAGLQRTIDYFKSILI